LPHFFFFKLLYKEAPDEGLCEPKYVALCYMAFKFIVGRYIFISYKIIIIFSFVNYTEKRKWMHQNKIRETIAVCSQIHTKNVYRVGQKVKFLNVKPDGAASVVAFSTQVRGFKPGRSRRIFRAKKSSARLPSEGK